MLYVLSISNKKDFVARQNQQTIGLQMDPFLSGVTDHTRQESGDSGLSLSSNNYSIPHTPDFLGNMDDSMDCISGKSKNKKFNMNIHFNKLFLFFLFAPWTNIESGTMESISANLETTDDLVPSLQQVKIRQI